MNEINLYEGTDYTNNNDYSFFINQYINYYNNLISKMCHELNNPLTLINSTLQIIEVKHPEIKELKYWDSLIIDVQECLELIDDFKDSRNHLDIKICNDNLLQVIESAVNSVIPLAEANTISLLFSFNEDSKPYYINYPFDKIRIKQTFINIIKNAVEAVDEGGYVIVYCSSDDTNLIIEVKDNGLPIPANQKEEIFKDQVTSKPKGEGLGLPIAKSIILSHLGDIHVSSDDKETNFRVTLPIHNCI